MYQTQVQWWTGVPSPLEAVWPGLRPWGSICWSRHRAIDAARWVVRPAWAFPFNCIFLSCVFLFVGAPTGWNYKLWRNAVRKIFESMAEDFFFQKRLTAEELQRELKETFGPDSTAGRASRSSPRFGPSPQNERTFCVAERKRSR